MSHREQSSAPRRVITYCLVPHELAVKLHDPLRRHFRDDPSVEAIVDQRGRERRTRPERRTSTATDPPAVERRRIRNAEGRRIADRRAALVAVDPPADLPRRARPFADRLVFVERLEPSELRLEDIDTARIVVRIQAGERNAFADVYMRYFDRVYGYLRVAFKDSHEAEDATQQVFLKVYEALATYDRSRSPFRAWLFAIVRNHAVDELRRRKRLEPLDETALERHFRTPGEPEGELAALGWLSDQDLLLFIERLPLAQRQVLMLRYMLDLTTQEIADLLERSPDDVRKLQSRALEFIRARLTALGRTTRRSPARMRRARRVAPVLRVRRFALIDRI